MVSKNKSQNKYYPVNKSSELIYYFTAWNVPLLYFHLTMSLANSSSWSKLSASDICKVTRVVLCAAVKALLMKK